MKKVNYALHGGAGKVYGYNTRNNIRPEEHQMLINKTRKLRYALVQTLHIAPPQE